MGVFQGVRNALGLNHVAPERFTQTQRAGIQEWARVAAKTPMIAEPVWPDNGLFGHAQSRLVSQFNEFVDYINSADLTHVRSEPLEAVGCFMQRLGYESDGAQLKLAARDRLRQPLTVRLDEPQGFADGFVQQLHRAPGADAQHMIIDNFFSQMKLFAVDEG